MIPLQASPLAGDGVGLAFLVGRVLFGVVIAFFGLNHFLQAESMVGYADAKGVPAASLLVPFSGGQLLFGGLGIAVGVFPTLAAGAVAVFLLVTTPLMHDFWAVPQDQQQDELINFLKNVGLFGVSVVLLGLSVAPWPYALGVGAF